MSKAAVIRRLSDEGMTAAEIVAKTGYVHEYVWRTLDKAKKLPWQRQEAAITDMTPPMDVAYHPPMGGVEIGAKDRTALKFLGAAALVVASSVVIYATGKRLRVW
ncbi:hypothetical protein ABOZ73_00585 [Caulobacter sp. 73W]|uniref:Uncharacterized protein n=1 Tax=Caulobacter sp. 73W TaxID=3161137 RepID=A0AB39KT30_9CAUL